jgi:hypothetical protein
MNETNHTPNELPLVTWLYCKKSESEDFRKKQTEFALSICLKSVDGEIAVNTYEHSIGVFFREVKIAGWKMVLKES